MLVMGFYCDVSMVLQSLNNFVCFAEASFEEKWQDIEGTFTVYFCKSHPYTFQVFLLKLFWFTLAIVLSIMCTY